MKRMAETTNTAPEDQKKKEVLHLQAAFIESVGQMSDDFWEDNTTTAQFKMHHDKATRLQAAVEESIKPDAT